MEVKITELFNQEWARDILEVFFEEESSRKIDELIEEIGSTYVDECSDWGHTDMSKYGIDKQVNKIVEWSIYTSRIANIINKLSEVRQGDALLVWED